MISKLRLKLGHIQDFFLPKSLLLVQKNSFKNFINNSIKNVFKTIFPIINKKLNFELNYISHILKPCFFNKQECIRRGITYAASLKVKFTITIFPSKENNILVKDRLQELYICDIPIMTNEGSFVINGNKRVVVGQLQRCPGIYFTQTKKYGKVISKAQLIPAIGPWLDFEFDKHDYLFFRIDKRRKLPVTVLLKALNFSLEEIVNLCSKNIKVIIKKKKFFIPFIPNNFQGKASYDIYSNNILYIKKGEQITLEHIKRMAKDKITFVEVSLSYLLGKIVAKNYINELTGEIICLAHDELTETSLKDICNANINDIEIIQDRGNYIASTLMLDKSKNSMEAIKCIYKYISQSQSEEEVKQSFVTNLFFSQIKYNLSEVGRIKFNQSFENFDLGDQLHLTKKDIKVILKKLINIRNGLEEIDDLDHLGNRRLKCVGEILEYYFYVNLTKIAKLSKENFFLGSKEKILLSELKPEDVINVKPISSSIKDFFTTSPLSQFLEEANPLSNITHKRRVTALGPGGISRDRAGYDLRDIHYTHYGRICPIETPEGPNIGLINSLALYAQVNKYGFIETPYRKVIKGKIYNDIVYITATNEDSYKICPADTPLSDNNEFVGDLIWCRYKGEYLLVNKNDIHYMDVSTQQIVSIGASLIPFIEHNDANRALMGANMQRQAVPLLISEKPLIGTGMEQNVAVDAGLIKVAKRGGIVYYVDTYRIVILVDISKMGKDDYSCIDIYKLTKCLKSNQNTWINQRPCVSLGEKVSKGDIIADGPATDFGELALGKNLRVAFMSWHGYNFEDSIILSEKVVQQNKLTSIHVHELICIARATKLGIEEITYNIPYVSQSSLSNLDENGIIAIGTEVKEGDLLVGKITPKIYIKPHLQQKLINKTLKLEEKFLDSSLRVPKGISGTVIDVEILAVEGVYENEKYQEDQITTNKKQELEKENDIRFNLLLVNIFQQIKYIFKEEKDLDNKVKSILDQDKASLVDIKYILEFQYPSHSVINIKINKLRENYNRLNKDLQNKIKLYKKNLESPYELAHGVIKIVKIYLASKKNIQAGDKIVGRHGNKGVISKICSIEDMPYDNNGNPIDIILNPLGVPSRMNVGQIFETNLGLASKKIGDIIEQLIHKNNINDIRTLLHKFYEEIGYGANNLQISSLSDEDIISLANNIKLGLPMATPIFSGVTENDIKNMFKLLALPLSGQIELYDGRTGEKFDRLITVGYMYILKLNHLVDDKIHARSTGSYSLITKQPLGGKAQFGGQRFGEMEVWALEAYGAAFLLQEMLTVKSDDVSGRNEIFQNIVNKGIPQMSTTVPESFNVLISQIKSLCLNIQKLTDENENENENENE